MHVCVYKTLQYCRNLALFIFQHRFNDKNYLGFNPVTLVPFEPGLIDYDMLTAEHVSRR